MIGTLIAATVVLLGSDSPQQRTDTTFDVHDADRIAIENLSGSTHVSTWDRNAVRVRARHGSNSRVRVRARDAVIRIEADTRFGPPTGVEYDITVPRKFGVSVDGTFTDITVDGVNGDVSAETSSGQIAVNGATGRLRLESAQGAITVHGGGGRLSATTINQGVTVTDFDGDVEVDAVNGSLTLSAIDGRSVEASTVNGGVTYQGAIHNDGHYDLSTHNGDIVMTLPASANATISMATSHGSFESDFPLKLLGREHQEYTLAIGKGSARVKLESFGGTIRLRSANHQ